MGDAQLKQWVLRLEKQRLPLEDLTLIRDLVGGCGGGQVLRAGVLCYLLGQVRGKQEARRRPAAKPDERIADGCEM